MIILGCAQYSEAWYQAKAGVPSASNFDKIVTSKGEPSKQSQKYLYQLAGEKLLEVMPESYQSEAMKRGLEMEGEARKLFEMAHDTEVSQVGIVYPDEQKKILCSPDGLLGNTGLEIKCPLIHTHIAYLLEGKLPTEYIQQVQGSMFVTGFEHYFFMSYFPGLKPLILKVERDELFIKKLEAELSKFCLELVGVVRKLKSIS